jgi:3-dehydroquinate synthase
MAEVIKTAVLGDEALLDLLEREAAALSGDGAAVRASSELLGEIVRRCVLVKGRIVENDPTETGSERALLNLGHTFGHALEAVAGLGTLSHGEAVAWGIARSCALGLELKATPSGRAERLRALLDRFGYCTEPLHPAASAAFGGDREKAAAALIRAMASDKKKKSGELRFIVPAATGAEIVRVGDPAMIENLFQGGHL